MKNFPYNTYSCFLKKKYGEKIYKLPIKINATCPNKDGLLGYGDCIFCGIESGSFEKSSRMENSFKIGDWKRTTRRVRMNTA